MPDMNKFPLTCERAYPLLDISADFKLHPEDFAVEEILGFDLSDEGEHVFLKIRKKALTTEQAIVSISQQLGLSRQNLAYSGLKDKHAVTTQWLSFQWPIKKPLPEIICDHVDILQTRRHSKKLKRGVHKMNHFRILLKNVEGDKGLLENRLQTIAEHGVPNYFGLQRFGFNGNNVYKAEALFKKDFKCKKFQRGLYYSAARSYLFNRILHQRVLHNNWNQAIEGDCFQLQGSQSFFCPEPLCDTLKSRITKNDIHSTATLIGDSPSRLRADAEKLENQVKSNYPILCRGLKEHRLSTKIRALRLLPTNMNWQISDSSCEIAFALPSGAFATAVLHEIAQLNGESW